MANAGSQRTILGVAHMVVVLAMISLQKAKRLSLVATIDIILCAEGLDTMANARKVQMYIAEQYEDLFDNVKLVGTTYGDDDEDEDEDDDWDGGWDDDEDDDEDEDEDEDWDEDEDDEDEDDEDYDDSEDEEYEDEDDDEDDDD